MPFFSDNPWLKDASKFWLWVVLTVPSTGLAFAFYVYWKRRSEEKFKRALKPVDDGTEMGEV